MKLLDLLSVINDNKNVYVYDSNMCMVSYYDGKNSIGTCWNDKEVTEVSALDSSILVTIDHMKID